MADLENIARGLAANLRACLPADEGQVVPWLLDKPTTPCLQVAGIDLIDYDTLGFGADTGDTIEFIVEACCGKIPSEGAQRYLYGFLSGSASVKMALQADQHLTSRMLDNGTVQTGQSPLAEWVKVREYRGSERFELPQSGGTVLLATWMVEVCA